MTDEQLAEIKARAESATPGPWWVEAERASNEAFVAYGTQGDLSETFDLYEQYREDDYTFIAHSRADIPRLLLEVERLRAEVDRMTSPKPGLVMKPGFLTWLNQVADSLPPGTVIGVKVEKLQEWHEAGMTVEGAAERVKGGGT